MPYPNIDESLWGKMDNCVEQVMGKQPDLDKPAAIGICYQSVVEGKSLDDELRRWAGIMAAIKIGARHSAGDMADMQAMHDASKAMHDTAISDGAECADCPMKPSATKQHGGEHSEHGGAHAEGGGEGDGGGGSDEGGGDARGGKDRRRGAGTEARGKFDLLNRRLAAGNLKPGERTSIERRMEKLARELMGAKEEPEKSVKIGARNNIVDRLRTQDMHDESGMMHDMAVKQGAGCNCNMPETEMPEKSVPVSLEADDTLVAFGAEVKALGDGKVGGYLVRFSTADNPDLMGDFFTADTDFGPHKTTPIFYNHGLDATLKRRVLGEAQMGTDDVGVWLKGQLYLRDEYEKAIEADMIGKGKAGWSSGTAAHLVERKVIGRSNQIIAWPLGLDASVTPTPAEYRNSVISLKTFQGGMAGQPAADAVTAPTPPNIERIITMPELQVTPVPTEIPAWALELKTQNEALMAELKKPALPATNAAITAVADLAAEKPFKSMGEQLMAVKAVAIDPSRPDKRLLFLNEKAIKATGASEGTGADGGFLLQQEFTNESLNRVYNTGQIMSKTTKRPVGAGANGLVVNVINETSRALGSRFGGVRAYWLNEAGTKTSSKPTYRRWTLNLEKLIGLYYATDELLQDAVGLQGDVMDSFSKEINFACEDAVFNGLGAGAPLGILNAPATVSVSKETGQAAATIVTANLFKMWARMWAPARAQAAWFIDQSIEPQLMGLNLSVGTGGMPVYIPPGGLSASPYSMLLGRPVIPVEYCAVLGTVGDIILADLGEYRWIDKGGIVSAASIHVQFLTDETAFRFVYRCNGAPFWNSALTPKSAGDTLSPFITLATRA